MFIESFFLLFTSFIGLIALSIMLFSVKSNKMVNAFLILIVIITCSRFMLRASLNLEWIDFGDAFMDPMMSILMFNIPLCFLYYLYFKSIIDDNNFFDKRSLNHLVIPTLFMSYLVVIFILKINEEKSIKIINFIIAFALSLFYNIKSFILLKHYLRGNGKVGQTAHNKFMGKWISSIFVFSIIWISGFFVSLILDIASIESFKEESFLILQSMVWLFIFITILLRPELLVGIPIFMQRDNTETMALDDLSSVWKIQKESISNQKDVRLEEKMDDNMLNIIKEVEFLAVEQHFFRNQKINISELSAEMKIPRSHLVYVFKYHCHLTFTEYKTKIKIEDAMRLIESEYLTANTLESLAIEVGFSSYNPFFSAFKKLVGMSPNEYSLSLRSKKRSA